jgi:MerR family transcriptional regulator, copper efflux regulator
MDGSMHHIGTVATRTAMSLRTVRYYEEVGLVRPSGRSEGGFRLYTEADVQRLLLVRALRPAELANNELAELLELHERLATADESASGTGGDAPSASEARTRLGSLLDIAAQRLRLKRERLIAAELAVELLRSAAPRPPEVRG